MIQLKQDPGAGQAPTPEFVSSQFSLALLGSLVVSRHRHPLSYTRVPSRLRSCRLLSSIFVGREDERDYIACCSDIESVVDCLESKESYGDILFSLLDLVWGDEFPTLISRLESEDMVQIASEWAGLVRLVVPSVSFLDLTHSVTSLFHVAIEFEKLLGIADRPGVDQAVLRIIRTYPQEHMMALSQGLDGPVTSELSDPLWEIKTVIVK